MKSDLTAMFISWLDRHLKRQGIETCISNASKGDKKKCAKKVSMDVVGSKDISKTLKLSNPGTILVNLLYTFSSTTTSFQSVATRTAHDTPSVV